MCNVLKVVFALTVSVDIDLHVQTQRDGDTKKNASIVVKYLNFTLLVKKSFYFNGT